MSSGSTSKNNRVTTGPQRFRLQSDNFSERASRAHSGFLPTVSNDGRSQRRGRTMHRIFAPQTRACLMFAVVSCVISMHVDAAADDLAHNLMQSLFPQYRDALDKKCSHTASANFRTILPEKVRTTEMVIPSGSRRAGERYMIVKLSHWDSTHHGRLNQAKALENLLRLYTWIEPELQRACHEKSKIGIACRKLRLYGTDRYAFYFLLWPRASNGSSNAGFSQRSSTGRVTRDEKIWIEKHFGSITVPRKTGRHNMLDFIPQEALSKLRDALEDMLSNEGGFPNNAQLFDSKTRASCNTIFRVVPSYRTGQRKVKKLHDTKMQLGLLKTNWDKRIKSKIPKDHTGWIRVIDEMFNELQPWCVSG